MFETNFIVFSEWFLLSLALCSTAVVLDKNMDKYIAHGFMEHPTHPKMGYLCQLLFLGGILMSIFSMVINQGTPMVIQLFILRLTILTATIYIVRKITSFMLICYQLYTRWHIFG
jgi:hypothetical protein